MGGRPHHHGFSPADHSKYRRSPESGDTSTHMDVKDNVVTRGFREKKGNKKDMRFVIKNGEVKELYVDGERVPDKKMSDYQKETDMMLDDLADMENELIEARNE